MSDHQERARGERARLELTETEGAFMRLRAAALEEIVRTAADQGAKRERLIVTVQILDAVKDALGQLVAAGEAVSARQALAEVMRAG